MLTNDFVSFEQPGPGLQSVRCAEGFFVSSFFIPLVTMKRIKVCFCLAICVSVCSEFASYKMDFNFGTVLEGKKPLCCRIPLRLRSL